MLLPPILRDLADAPDVLRSIASGMTHDLDEPDSHDARALTRYAKAIDYLPGVLAACYFLGAGFGLALGLWVGR